MLIECLTWTPIWPWPPWRSTDGDSDPPFENIDDCGYCGGCSRDCCCCCCVAAGKSAEDDDELDDVLPT